MKEGALFLIILASIFLFGATVYYHPNFKIFKQHVEYKCCHDNICLMQGQCKSDLIYLANRCNLYLNDKLLEVNLTSITEKCYHDYTY